MKQKLKKPVVVYPRLFTVEQCKTLRAELDRQLLDTEVRADKGKYLQSATVGKGYGCSAEVLRLYTKPAFYIDKANTDNFEFDKVKPEKLAYVNRYSRGH